METVGSSVWKLIWVSARPACFFVFFPSLPGGIKGCSAQIATLAPLKHSGLAAAAAAMVAAAESEQEAPRGCFHSAASDSSDRIKTTFQKKNFIDMAPRPLKPPAAAVFFFF